ncbi:MAG: hypothetical protein FWF08_00650 [Oscillospiraceae bacterium]|nr:hypothetical protein [Oscillospiraceae bacterium]
MKKVILCFCLSCFAMFSICRASKILPDAPEISGFSSNTMSTTEPYKINLPEKQDILESLNASEFYSTYNAEIKEWATMTDYEIEKADQNVFDRANNELSCNKLITKRFPLRDLPFRCNISLKSIELYNTWRTHIYEIDDRAKIECLRLLGNEDYYAVFEIEEGGRVFCFFPKDHGYRLSHSVYVNRPGKESEYDRIKIGDDFKKIEKTDYGAALYDGYGMNWTSFNDIVGSYHLLKDSLIFIEYDIDNINHTGKVSNIKKLPDKIIFVPIGTYVEGANGGITAEDEAFDFTIFPQDYPE